MHPSICLYVSLPS